MKKSILLHSCCGPCSTVVISKLSTDFNVTVYYYNPNIEPFDEYLHRRNEQILFLNQFNPEIKLIDGDYDNFTYHEKIKEYAHLKEGSNRCYKCISFRMEETAKYAKENNYDYFDTTLSVSPHKNSDWINEIGELLEKKYQIKYLGGNYKKNDGYRESIILAKKYNLYRQDYCGCLMSKQK